MTVNQFMLKKFPTNEYMDCPVPTHYWETIQEYANAYHESKVKELNLHSVIGLVCPQCKSDKWQEDGRNVHQCMECNHVWQT